MEIRSPESRLPFQVRLTEEQHRCLSELAQRGRKSVSELIRVSVDALLASVEVVDQTDRRQRALVAIGRFRAGVTDLADDHNHYLAEATGN